MKLFVFYVKTETHRRIENNTQKDVIEKFVLNIWNYVKSEASIMKTKTWYKIYVSPMFNFL